MIGSESDDELMTSTAPSDVTEPLSVPSSPGNSVAIESETILPVLTSTS